MPWNHIQFVEQFRLCGNRYELENAWFKKEWWGDQRQYILAAWRLYRCAARSSLGMLLLGSAKIRKDPTLLANFGLTSAGGVNDPTELEILKEVERHRMAARTAPALHDAPAVVGPGSILNDRNWTPFLNDAYILGGVHAGLEFHFAEDDVNRYYEFLDRRALFERNQKPPDMMERWRGFFRAHPELLWSKTPWAPRILARELIGLKAFGYTPKLSADQLSFHGRTSSDEPTCSARWTDAFTAGKS
jgi:hypothetical protein